LDKWAIFWAVVVRTKKETRRDDGTFIRFGDNAVALVSRTDEPVGKRIFWPVAKELRKVGYTRIASMAEEVI
jgi:large subunit ribosomal protein L14